MTTSSLRGDDRAGEHRRLRRRGDANAAGAGTVEPGGPETADELPVEVGGGADTTLDVARELRDPGAAGGEVGGGVVEGVVEGLLRELGQDAPAHKPILELNPTHPVIAKLQAASDEDFAEWALLLYEEALLAEGGKLEDPAAFVQRMNRLLLTA